MGTEDARNLCQRVPGPKPIFTRRKVVKLRPDQLDAVRRIATTLAWSESDVIRWFIDQGTHAIESAPGYETLKEMRT